jgi:membrane associated rhomboid family serine protease
VSTDTAPAACEANVSSLRAQQVYANIAQRWRPDGGSATPEEIKGIVMRDLRRAAVIIGAFIAVIWIVGILDMVLFAGHLRTFGIVPRTVHGLMGILFAPFLHEGIAHLIGNTGGLLVFGGLVAFHRERDFWVVTCIGALASGVGTWLFGRNALHIGASGVIFAYFGYLLLTGWFERRIASLLLSIAVFVIWWPTLWGLSPLQMGISWEGHLFGLLGGVWAAWLLARGRRRGAPAA